MDDLKLDAKHNIKGQLTS